MLVRILVIFFTFSICLAGHIYESQRCPSGYCSRRPQFPATFAAIVLPQYFQRQDPSYRFNQQGDGRKFLPNQQQYVNHQHRQYTNQRQQYANQQQQNLNRPQQYVNQQTQYVQQPSQYVNQPPKFVNQPQQYVNQPSQYVNQPPKFVNQPQQYVNQPSQYISQPQQSALGYFYDKPTPPLRPRPTSSPRPTSPPKTTVRPTPTSPSKPPAVSPPSQTVGAVVIEEVGDSDDERISEKKCEASYFPEGTVTIAVAGGEIATPGGFQYMAAIGYRRPAGGFDYGCGGTLISENFILTAAHCRVSNGQRAAVARIGGARLDDNAPENQPQEITGIITHPRYRRKQVYNDIALFKLKDASSRRPACLSAKDVINQNTATAIGYGQTGFGLKTSTDLMTVDLQLYSTQVCQQYYSPRFSIERGLIDSQLCAGDFNKVRDTCPGDSGGPLLEITQSRGKEVPYVLAVTSFGPGCAEGVPGVYTKVSSYIDWIEAVVWPGE